MVENDIINDLIDIDKKAREIVKQAEIKSQDIISSVDLSKKEYEIKYDDQASLRLKEVKEEETEKIKKACKEIKSKYSVFMDRLEKAYFKNHKMIENQIFEKIINYNN